MSVSFTIEFSISTVQSYAFKFKKSGYFACCAYVRISNIFLRLLLIHKADDNYAFVFNTTQYIVDMHVHEYITSVCTVLLR
jgi:hypothetical protein